LHEIVIPESGDFDVENTAQPLVNGLYAEPGHRPLLTEPEDVAV
jgi:hypothetical protein